MPERAENQITQYIMTLGEEDVILLMFPISNNEVLTHLDDCIVFTSSRGSFIFLKWFVILFPWKFVMFK